MKHKYIKLIIIFLVIVIILLISYFFYLLTPVNDNSETFKYKINLGTSVREIVDDLKEKSLIKSEYATLIYLKLNSKIVFKAGTYELSRNMATDEILNIFNKGLSIEKEGINITFVEGKRLTKYVSLISDKFNYSEEEIYEVLSNKTYLNELIDKYWFITAEILNKDLYYPLEGYLYPDTYNFSLDSSIEDIISVLLNNFNKKLEPYKTKIEASKYTFHEILSLASDVELEGKTVADRKLIAGIFLNRLNKNMSLGSDVTTYYAVNKELNEELWQKDLNEINPYNTRGGNMSGKINVGPICNPAMSSITAVLEPTNSDYYYFYADYKGDGTIYYTKNLTEHQKIVSKFEK